MRIRYFSFLSLGIAGAFLVVASQAFNASDTVNVALGVGIGTLVVSVFTAERYRHNAASLAIGAVAAAVSVWTIVSSQIFANATIHNLTFASGLAVAGLAIIGLTAHALRTARGAHS